MTGRPPADQPANPVSCHLEASTDHSHEGEASTVDASLIHSATTHPGHRRVANDHQTRSGKVRNTSEPVGAENPYASRDLSIFVDQPVEAIQPHERYVGRWSRRWDDSQRWPWPSERCGRCRLLCVT